VMPKVSVIVPSYNHAAFVGQRIQSVLDQTFHDYELIILDDASTDPSQDVLSAYDGLPNIRLIFNQTNSGSVFCQWNRGVREAQGEYVWIAESDDFADPHFLERLVGVLDANPDVGVAYCDSVVVSESGSSHGSGWNYFGGGVPQRWTQDFVNTGRVECAQYLVVENTIPNASAVLFRKSVYERAGYADESMKYAGDWMQWAKMLMISNVAFVHESLNHYRRHANAAGNIYGMTYRSLKEFLLVSGFIAKQVYVPDENRIRFRSRYTEIWGEMTTISSNRLSYRDGYELSRLALRLDVRLFLSGLINRLRYIVYHQPVFTPVCRILKWLRA
jgi:glycosyltransferase involved in cell wall biosynthesis